MAAPLTRAGRLLLLACFAVPAVVLAACYAWLAADRGTLWLWDVVVHESGRYTLAQTVLYFGHFLRELPTDLAYALFLLAAAGGIAERSERVAPDTGARYGRQRDRATRSAVTPEEAMHNERPPTAGSRGRVLALLGLGGAALVVVIAATAAASTAGWRSALLDLAQFRTRDEVSAYGSHWRYHWLSTLWFGAAVGAVGSIAARLTRDSLLRASAAWERVAWGYFVVLTIVFGVSTDVFTDPRYVGHQAREILTHGPVTALLGLGALAVARRWLGLRDDRRGQPSQPWLRLVVAIAIPAYLSVSALGGDVLAAGQTEHGLAAMVAAHWFEHGLDYLIVPLMATGALGASMAFARPRA